ncbi:hypothetical protein M7I_5570 [Glarea lozoyensis 74030]|uniref:Uncharacterized protein n=1 Tax=Glarea lozoyensis (strain ATCC 74030 / MF5533) TaxID=1104152 RepID=H0ES92_GLAL7|nr:hypothetical protein M7I_5570 [Glarea lozoyensis 74030]
MKHTVICGGVTFYALGDMMVHNRRKRAEFFTEQKALKASAIQTAKQALDQGVATEDQLAFLRREEEHDAQLAAAAKAKAAKKGIFKKSKEWLFSGLKKEEGVELAENNEREISHGEISEEGSSIKERASDVSRAIGQTQSAISDKTKGAFEEEKQRQRVGGPLDRLGTATESDMDEDKPKSGGWTSFMVLDVETVSYGHWRKCALSWR